MAWKELFLKEWSNRVEKNSSSQFPLIFQNFTNEDLLAMVDVCLSGQLTMSDRVRTFEKEFAAFIGAPYAVMVNSGSSANLLALAVASNPARKHHFKQGDEILVPAVCWSTSVWPILQLGLKPVFVDVDPTTLNMDIEAFRSHLNPRVKGVVGVHILGNSTDMNALMKFCESERLILIEDTCESLGSKYSKKNLGTFGDFGTYSFYYSHHMTTGEGGMVICKNAEDYDLLKCLRAHGWSRELSNKVELEKQNPDVDPRFLFVNVGYNLRPMEIQAALGSSQLKRLPDMNSNRIRNNDRIIAALKKHKNWDDQFTFVSPQKSLEPVWFGMCLMLNKKFLGQKTEFLQYLQVKGVENRPIVSGNFARQPALKLFGVNPNPEKFPGAELVHSTGFFIGVHTDILPDQKVEELADILLSFSFK